MHAQHAHTHTEKKHMHVSSTCMRVHACKCSHPLSHSHDRCTQPLGKQSHIVHGLKQACDLSAGPDNSGSPVVCNAPLERKLPRAVAFAL